MLLKTSAPYTPEQNSLAERTNQFLATLANTMLEKSKLPKSFWADAMSTAAYISAHSPTSGLWKKVPYQVFFNRQVDPTFFCPFGCLAYAYTSKKQWGGKFRPHGKKCIMIGYTYGQQAYKLLDIERRTILSSRHVTFNESGTISGVESAPWNTPTVEGQWEGLVPEHLCEPEDDHDGHRRPVGVIPPPNPRPVGDIPTPAEIICLASPDIKELADCLNQL